MITEDYVSFETAKLLKEKGFTANIHGMYDHDGKFCEATFTDVEPYYSCYAPTLQMTMKWLREAHNIDISVTPDRKNGYSVLIFKDKRLPFDTLDSYSIYEQACEAAIRYCLDNLISMTQEVLVHIKLNEKKEPIVELRYQDKIKTFISEFSINRFVGVYNGLLNEQVTSENYIAAKMYRVWDGGIEMTAEEWYKCVKAIYREYKKN